MVSSGFFLNSSSGINEITALFAVYSFTGWIIEVIYRSYKSRKYVNAGFLHGPFLPVYGIGALILIFLDHLTGDSNLVLKFIIFTAALTIIEYATGALFKRIFNLVLWDYSENRFNIKGRVCLSFSLAWGVMAILFTEFLHPFTNYALGLIPHRIDALLIILFSAYFLADLTFSVTKMNMFRKKIAYLYEEYLSLSSQEIDSILNSFKRILGAFPDLNSYLDLNIKEGIKNRVDDLIREIKTKPLTILNDRKPDENEYNNIVRDILENEEFMKLKNYYHHNSSIFEHAEIVSWISYSICKYLNLDYTSAARGALLHDFFLYDWRNHDEPELAKEKFHGLEHPKIALENSRKHFNLNKIEEDIIIKHMWPLTLLPPRYRESFIVTFVDKYTASREFVDSFDVKAIIKRLNRIKR